MKKTIKVKFLSGFENARDDIFIRLLKKDYNLVQPEEPDFIFYTLGSQKERGLRKGVHKLSFLSKYVSGMYQKLCATPVVGGFFYHLFYDKVEMPILKTKAKRIFYTIENCRPDMKNCEWAFTFDYDEELSNKFHLRLPYYKVEGADKNLIKKNLDFSKIKKQKTRFCAFIYSKNVPFRNKFFKELSKYKHVDAPGNSMRNMPPFGGQKNAKTRFIPNPSRGNWQGEKIDFLSQYKFTVAFENSSFPGYTTEKIYHPMLANSIPIYWGNRLVHRDFNPKSFINYYDFERDVINEINPYLLRIPIIKKIVKRFIIPNKTIKKMIERIIEIDNNDELYKKYLMEPWYNNNKPSKYVDDNLIRKKLNEIFN